MESIDCYFGIEYDLKKYNCLHFAAKVYSDLTNIEVSENVFNFFYGKFPLTEARKFKRLPAPESPCLVVFRVKNQIHIGVFIRGKVLHLCDDGVQYLPLETIAISFRETRFYKYVE